MARWCQLWTLHSISCLTEQFWSSVGDGNREESSFALAHRNSAERHCPSGSEPSYIQKVPISPRRKPAGWRLLGTCKYSQLSISYRICFSNYLCVSLMTQHKLKWLLAKLQVAERSRAFGHVFSYLLECATKQWMFLVLWLSLYCLSDD